MENKISTEDKELIQIIIFKAISFPDITLDYYDNLIFHHSFFKCQKILQFLIKEIDEK